MDPHTGEVELVPPWARQQIETDDPGSWEVTDLGSAEWAMERLREAGATVATLESQYQTWKAVLDAWLDDAARPARNTVEFFSGKLEAYGLAQRALTGAATVKLPGGKIGTRKSAAAVVVQDEDELLRFASETPVVDANGEVRPLADLVTQRKLSLTMLRDQVAIVERPTGAHQMNYPCSHFVIHQGVAAPLATCPVCGADGVPEAHVVMEQVVVLADHLLSIDDPAPVVPGATVKPETITAHAVPLAVADPVQGLLQS